MTKLRPYPFHGKFEGGLAIDPLAYAVALEFSQDHIGHEGGPAWFLISRPEPTSTELCLIEANYDEREFLAKTVGAIVHETEFGFVSVDWHTDPLKLAAAWSAIGFANKE